MKKSIHYIYILIFIALWGCEDYYVPEIDRAPNSLVVEGILTDKHEQLTVKLSRTIPFDDRSYFYGERNARVTLQSKSGENFNMREYASGYYITNDSVQAREGELYRLYIKTDEGDVYTSDWEIMMGHNDIAEIQYVDSVYKEVNYDYWGDPFVTDFNGIFVSVMPEPPSDSNVGYLYKWNSLINYYVYSSEGMNSYSYYCWKKMYSNTLYVYDHNESQTGHSIILDNLHFMSYYSLYPNHLDTARFDGEIQQAYSTSFYYLLEQYTITKRGTEFWKGVKRQSEATGKLFDPVEEDIITNMHCDSDTNKLCLGYFNTASFSEMIMRVGITNKKIRDVVQFSYFPMPKETEDCLLGEQTEFWYIKP